MTIPTTAQLKEAQRVLRMYHPNGARISKTVDTLENVTPNDRQLIRYYEQRGIKLLKP